MAKVATHDIVDSFLKHNKNDLIFIEEYDSFFVWQDGWYQELTKREFQKKALTYTKKLFPHQALSDAYLKNFYVLASLTCNREIPLNTKIGGYISFNDKLLNTLTLEIEEKDRKKICLHHIPYNLSDIQKPTPVFDNFLKTSLVHEDTTDPDKELIKLVQEMLGFFLLDIMKGAAAFFFVGEGSNGKSTFIKVVEKMIGEKFISAMSIQSLTTDKFASHNLIGKKLNISNEEESRYMEASVFKALVSGDRVAGQRKFGETFEFVPRAKFVFATNELPTFKSMNHALKRRIKIIPFHRIFEDSEQDKELDKKLEKEIVGIIGWAIEGAKRFIANNYVFSDAEASRKRMVEFENETSASIRFIRENYEVDDDAKITNADLYQHYCSWCKDEVGRSPKNRDNFLQDIKYSIRGIKSVIMRNGTKTTRGRNLILKDDIEEETSTIDEAIDMIK